MMIEGWARMGYIQVTVAHGLRCNSHGSRSMKVETLLNLATSIFRQKLRENCPESTLPDLTPDAFNHLVQAFKSAFSACGTQALQAYLESCDEKGFVLASPGGQRQLASFPGE